MVKCKKCKKEMEEVDSGFTTDDKRMIVDFTCSNCNLYCEATWFCNKHQKTKWLKLKDVI